MKIGILTNQDSPGTDYYRTIGPLKSLSRIRRDIEIVELRHDSPWSKYFRCDVVVFQRPSGDGMLNLIRECKRMGVKVVIDHDDLLTDVPPANPVYGFFKQEHMQKTIIECFQYADAVIVSTPALQEAFKHLHSNITIIPNGVDLSVTPFQNPIRENPADRVAKERNNKANQAASLKVLWRGSMTHMEDLKEIEAFWKWGTLQQHVSVGWIGLMPAYVHTHYPGILCRDWRPNVFHYFEELKNSEADYGVFPLSDNLFNHAKSNIFAMEMLVAGIVPYVPAGFAEFKHPGVRHFEDARGLITEFYALLKDDTNYAETVQAGRDWIEQERDVNKLNLKRIEIFENL
jgi:hypothetical protein